MAKTINTKLLLAKYSDENGIKQQISIFDYHNFVVAKDKDAIADLIFFRLHSRYIKPFKYCDIDYTRHYKNSFSIMANCCLLIETLESFKNGLADSNRQSQKLFVDFLSTDKNFTAFKAREVEFYFSVRCGILHQGETTNGYILTISGSIFFDVSKLKINAVMFLENLEKSLNEYRSNLKSSDWSDPLWQNLFTKMTSIINNCAK